MPTSKDAPFPDSKMLMDQLRASSEASKDLRHHYTYHDLHTEEDIDSGGNVKKTFKIYMDIDYVDGVQIHRVLQRNGKDLSDEEKQKQEERIQEYVARVKQIQGRNQSAGFRFDITRLLSLVTLSNPRRIVYNNRDTLVYDFTANPTAPSNGEEDDALKRLSGVIWVDEKDHTLVKINAHLADNFRIGGGLLVNAEKGSGINIEQTLVHDEAWLPATVSIDYGVHLFLLKGLRQRIRDQFSDYKKYQTDVIFMNTKPVIQPDTPSAH